MAYYDYKGFYKYLRNYRAEKECKACSKEFVAYAIGQKYCSDSCRFGRYVTRLGDTLQCRECSKGFVKLHGRQVFCSKACRKQDEIRTKCEQQKLRHQGSYRKLERKEVNGVTVCPFCGDGFMPRHGNQVFCSMSCKNAHAKGGKYVKGMEKECNSCGTSFVLAHGAQKYCSHGCGLDVNSDLAVV